MENIMKIVRSRRSVQTLADGKLIGMIRINYLRI